jgi:hypothetical protein
MACDSRWSIQNHNFILYIDDTGFEKIIPHNGIAFMFAGNGYLNLKMERLAQFNAEECSEPANHRWHCRLHNKHAH